MAKKQIAWYKKMTAGQWIGFFAVLGLAGAGVWLVVGALPVGWGLPWQSVTPPGDDGVDTTLPAWTTDMKLKVIDALDENAAIGGVAVSIYDTNWNLLESGTTASGGTYTTTSGFYTSYNTYKIMVGSLTNGTYLSQSFSVMMPGEQSDSKPSSIAIATPLAFYPVAEENQVTLTCMRLGSTITAYNHTTLGDYLTASLQIQMGTAERSLRTVWDAGEKLSEQLVFTMMITNVNASSSQAIDVSGMSYTMKGTTSTKLLVSKTLSEWYYDVDSNGAVISGRDGLLVVPISMDFSSCGLSSSIEGTAFTVTWYVTIGTTPSQFTSAGLPDSDNVFQDTGTLTITC